MKVNVMKRMNAYMLNGYIQENINQKVNVVYNERRQQKKKTISVDKIEREIYLYLSFFFYEKKTLSVNNETMNKVA